MTTKRFYGFVLLAIPFVGISIAMVLLVGWLMALGIWALSVALMWVIIVGVNLITE